MMDTGSGSSSPSQGQLQQQQLTAALDENKRLLQENERLWALLDEVVQSNDPAGATQHENLAVLPADAARAVQAWENLLAMVLKQFPYFVSYSNQELRYVYARRSNTKKCDKGYNDLDFLGQTDVELFPEGPLLLDMQASVFRTGIAERQELKVAKSGRTSFLVLICKPFYRSGVIDGVLSLSIDFTSQLEMEGRVRHIESELGECKALEETLRRRIEVADQAIEAKNSFLAVMSHEIRTPLNGVLGMAQVLATTSLDQEQKELVDAMVFSGDVILAIISDILDLSKVESGTMKLEEREFNPRDVVKHVVRAGIAATKNRGIKIEAQIGECVPSMVVGDPLRLKQVITNLVFNAVKFTKEGHVRVHLKALKNWKPEGEDLLAAYPQLAKTTTDEGVVESADIDTNWDLLLESGRREDLDLDTDETQGVQMEEAGTSQTRESEDAEPTNGSIWLQFAVEDTGIGIPQDAFPYLFEKFTQVHSSTTRKYGGTGLGLAICKQLVELMGGRISVSSEVGVGSTFVFTVCCKHNGLEHSEQPIGTSPPQDEKVSIHKLQAGLSCSVSSTLSCPLTAKLTEEFGLEKLKPAENEQFPWKPQPLSPPRGRLRRTLSGPPRMECTLKSTVSDIRTLSNAAVGGRRRQPRLLLAEDNKVNVMVAMSMLKKLGLTADVVYNGQEALNAIRKKKYDLVLMDVCMPVLDGLEVTRRVRKFERTGNWDGIEGPQKKVGRRLPIVAMTANALSDFEEQCVQHGMDSFVTKPITFNKMRDMLGQFLGKNRLETVTESVVKTTVEL